MSANRDDWLDASSTYMGWMDACRPERAWKELDVDAKESERLVERAANEERWRLAMALSQPTSPIERKLLLAFLGYESEDISDGRTVTANHLKIVFGVGGGCLPDLAIELQSVVGPYRADFLLSLSELGPGGVVTTTLYVEADGHDFHERTKKQAAHDKKRDRFFTAEGHTLLRFTGSEIHHDAPKCAAEVMKVLLGRQTEAMKPHWDAYRAAQRKP